MRALFITSLAFAVSSPFPAFAQRTPLIPSIAWAKNTIDTPLSPSWTLPAGDQQRTLRSNRYRRMMHPRFAYRLNHDRISPMLTFRVARHLTPELGLGVSITF